MFCIGVPDLKEHYTNQIQMILNQHLILFIEYLVNRFFMVEYHMSNYQHIIQLNQKQ